MSAPFHRTPHGLSNQATFEKVDAIVYAEGGSRFYTRQDLELGGGDPNTLDAAFWYTNLRLAVPHKKVRVRSVGNKTTLVGIAHLLVAGSVSRVIVAMDRDFDDRRGRRIDHRNVFYTHGYSWENDVFNEAILIAVVSDLAPQANILDTITAELKRASRELRRCFSTVVRLDHYLAVAGTELTHRGELERSIRPNEKHPPIVVRSVIATELTRVRAAQSDCRLGPRNCALVDHDLHGHTLSKWWTAYVHHLLRSHFSMKMSNDMIARLAISAFARSQSPSMRHYQRQAMEATWLTS